MISLLQAYVDPTAGGMLLQIILGGLAAGFLAVQMFWKRILGFFGKGRDKPPSPPDDAVKIETEAPATDSTAPAKDQT